MTKYYKPGDNWDFFLTVLEVVSLESGCQHGSGSGKGPPPGCRLLTSCILTGQRRELTLWPPVIYKGTKPVHPKGDQSSNSWSLLKLMTVESVMPSTHLILCHPLILPPSVFPSIKVFSKGSAPCIRAKVLELQFQHQSFQWIFRIDFL